MPELMPCPCCGGRAEFDRDDYGYKWIECVKCGLSTDTGQDHEDDCRIELAKDWNRRAIPAVQVLVPRELCVRILALAEDAMGLDFSEHDAIHDELRTLLQR